MKKKTAFILDGYVDEPACFGVSPYISPSIRTLAGVLTEREFETGYLTIDQVRQDPATLRVLNECSLVVMVAGVTVPGKYMGGTPATLTEIHQIGAALSLPEKVLAGPIAFGSTSKALRPIPKKGFISQSRTARTNP